MAGSNIQSLFPMLICFTVLGLSVAGFAWWRLRCPNCNRIFTRELVDKKTTRRELLVFKAEERFFYQCRRCNHAWHRDMRYDGD